MANVGGMEMLSDNLIGWDVCKTTTDKLEDILNGYAEGWTVWKVEYLGGRDWLVITRCSWDSLEDKCNDFGEDLANWNV